MLVATDHDAEVAVGTEPWAGRPPELDRDWLPSACDMPGCTVLVATEADGNLLADQMRQYVLCNPHTAAVRLANPTAQLVAWPRR